MRIIFEANTPQEAMLFQRLIEEMGRAPTLDTALSQLKERNKAVQEEISALTVSYEINLKDRRALEEELSTQRDSLEAPDDLRWGIYRVNDEHKQVICLVHAPSAKRAVEIYMHGFPDGTTEEFGAANFP